MAKSDTASELEKALRAEKQERSEAEERASRANERAKQAEEAQRKMQMDLVTARDEVEALKRKLEAVEGERSRPKKGNSAPAPAPASPAPAQNAQSTQVEEMLAGIESLRQLLARASIELSELHADEAALAKKRSRVLADVCALLAKATGESGQAPPPIPATALERRLTVAPAVDISEVAELIESLRPPAAPKVD